MTRLSDELGKMGVVGDQYCGRDSDGLGFDARVSTKDVGAIFQPVSAVRSAAARVAQDMALPSDWLNDSVKGFLSPRGDFEPIPSIALSHLRLQAPTLEYILAMKVLAARKGLGEEHGDGRDIEFLLRRLGLRKAEAVMAIVQRYYDPSRILPRSHYVVDEILESIEGEINF